MSQKVVVAMSGGVDSSVTAALLKEQGYDVVGVTLRLANYQETEGRKFGGCCGSKDFFDARSVAQTLDIPHYSFDYVENFRQSVIGYFKDSYLNGETPNPCIACNQFVKFDRLLEQAQALGADYLATGHYARIEAMDAEIRRRGDTENHPMDVSPRPPVPASPGRRYLLKRAVDDTKDQSYVLYHLSQAQLSKLLFPLGDYTKTEIREFARRYQLVTADKPDSQEICFVPNEDYRQFIREESSEAERPGGEIRDREGHVLGRHQGLPFYTIGQRQGLGLSVGKPLYVIDLDRNTNSVIVGDREDLVSRQAEVRQVCWTSGQPTGPREVDIKIRYKHTPARATITSSENGRASVLFQEPQSAITPGQAAVFYEGDVVLGGGTIDRVSHA